MLLLMRTKFCYCGGRYGQRGSCQRRNCPRATLGRGCWHLALPKLRALNDRSELFDRYPDIQELEEHVERASIRRSRYPEMETRGRNMMSEIK